MQHPPTLGKAVPLPAPVTSTARGDLRKAFKAQPLPVVAPDALAATAGIDATSAAQSVLDKLSSAISTADAPALEGLFLAPGEGDAYWKDQLALTYHLRTFHGPHAIVSSLLELASVRGVTESFKPSGDGLLLPVGPTLAFIDYRFKFTTASPSTSASGRLMLIPVKSGEALTWKIWVLSTWLEALTGHPEDTNLLQIPKKDHEGQSSINTDVFIIGGGNAAATLSARLKALGVSSLMAERNDVVGANWDRRHDNLRFHAPTSFCTMPYLAYPKEFQSPYLLSKADLAAHLRRYVEDLNLDVITSARVSHTEYNQVTKEWTVAFSTPGREKKATAKHLVLATGVGSQVPYMPVIADRELYKGQSLHANEFRNGDKLKEQGVKTVLVVGSANTAFDVAELLHEAGCFQTTMNVRSPTYICPIEQVTDPRSLGAFDAGVEAGDDNFQTIPSVVDAQLGKGLFAFLTSQDVDRYKPLAAAGFPVVDGLHPDASLMHNLVERAGGHYMDHGGTKLIVDGHVKVTAGVEPVAYTSTGVKFSDGSTMDVDAIIWCTGYSDTNVQEVALEILGGGSTTNGTSAGGSGDVLGPAEIAARVEPTWAVDLEGEIRGLWKRHAQLDDNFWITGGYTSLHRWHSRTLALQIKAALEGILPPAYRKVPEA
ncbi:uncharacterized protein B0I36DRAFT_424358 [Microdochium trichocladiopsis]|uniref:FAD/NAD(P)-binding domain-containing protein n=1 Tax=Microdochium trichocladiopsis TaxID=1682393 RepID=A0A9P8XZR6_9PEZI|nr:uncharacterized protein B0I36DRAFT_424358 [Microdochium trichocladiopsis]KAH7026715.1 hypothetical protein B0I36DRAFT_424358 [Microdochium trichocladiopsis]